MTDFAFDVMDRLASVTLPDGKVARYTYDTDGRRIEQSVEGQSTHFLWDETSPYGDVILETSAAGNVEYTLVGGQLLSQTRNGTVTYYLQDGQGSTRALADPTGTLTNTYSYTAFGEIYSQSGTAENSYLYTGQQLDELTGLYDLRARYYDPGVGRFLSQDTAGLLYDNPMELNRYGYTANNPVNLSDPSGHGADDEYGGLLGIVQNMSQWPTFRIPSVKIRELDRVP